MISTYLLISLFSWLILGVLFVKTKIDVNIQKSKKAAIHFIVAGVVYVAMDAIFVVTFLDRSQSARVEYGKVVAFLFYLSYIAEPYVWYRFIKTYIDLPTSRFSRYLANVVIAVQVLMLLLSVPLGIVYKVSSHGEYLRGPFFNIFSILNVSYYLLAFSRALFALWKEKYNQPKYAREAVICSSVPLVGAFVNLYLIPEGTVMPFQPLCMVLTTLLVYLFMVDRERSTRDSENTRMLAQALEQQKQATATAQSVGEVKTRFLENISQDIRVPVNAIMGYTDLLKKNCELNENGRDYVARIEASGDYLVSLVNNVLEISRIESELELVDKVPVYPKQILNEVAAACSREMSRKNISFKIDANVNTSCVYADNIKIRQVFTNLISNACLYTPEGGSITLAMREENCDMEGYTKLITSVIDTGVGMSKSFAQVLLEQYTLPGVAITDDIHGTGMNLAIVKKLVDLIGGTIEVESEIGKGTTFTVTTISRIAKEPTGESDKIDISLAGKRILIAEDNDLSAEIVIELLSECGVVVDRAQDGAICFDMYNSAAPGYYDLILMDVQMPNLTGYEVTRKIRKLENEDKRNIPIIAMTANTFEENRNKALAVGMNEHITKPFSAKKLLAAIARVINEEEEYLVATL